MCVRFNGLQHLAYKWGEDNESWSWFIKENGEKKMSLNIETYNAFIFYFKISFLYIYF
jgi:hypothetical protein